MKIIPAIDLMGGKVVRLKRGDFKEVTCYSEDPADIARKWEAGGAGLIHVVDLDGALGGAPENTESVAMIKKAVKIPIELGGGLRTMEDLGRAFDAGVDRAVIGTKLADGRGFITGAVELYKEAIVAGIDSRHGMVATQGWTERSSISALDMAREVEATGVSTIIYTDIASDGMLSGPNILGLADLLKAVNVSVIASGGVSSLEDIKKLMGIRSDNLSGVIVGRALYEKRFSLPEAVKICSRKG